MLNSQSTPKAAPKAAKQGGSPQAAEATSAAGASGSSDAESSGADFAVQLSKAAKESDSPKDEANEAESTDAEALAAKVAALKKKVNSQAKGNSETDAAAQSIAVSGAANNPAIAQGMKSPSSLQAQAAALKKSENQDSTVGLKAGAAVLSAQSSSLNGQEGVQKINASTRHNLQDQAEMSPKTSQAAASVNTAQTIAGLKPWSKNWVFEGAEENPQLQPLIGSAPKNAQEIPVQMRAQGGNAHSSSKPQTQMQFESNPDFLQAPSQKGRGMPETKASATGEAFGAQPAMKNLGPQEAGLDASLLAALAGLNGEIQGLETSEGFSDGPVAMKPGRSGVQGGARGLQGPNARARTLGPSGEDFLSMRGGDAYGVGVAGASGARVAGSPMSNAAFEEKQFWEGPGMSGGMGQAGSDPIFNSGSQLGANNDLAFNGLVANPALMDQHSRQDPTAFNPNAPVMNLTGQVTQGSMAKNRLSTESLVGMTGGIRQLSSQGGGEMKIRLRPDNLGELEVRVFTRGNSVGLKFQASDAKAKKVIEDSLGYLKDNMAAQNLTVAKIEIGVAQPASQSQGQGDNPFGQFRDQQNSNFNAQQNPNQWGGANQNEFGERRGNMNDGEDSDRVRGSSGLRSSAKAGASAGAQRFSGAGANGSGQRLNLLA